MPTPAFAPGDKPVVGVAVDDGVGWVVWDGCKEDVLLTEVVLVVEETVEELVMEVDVTKRLESEDWSKIVIGCAHITIGPKIIVPWSLCEARAATTVELDVSNVLVHPAYIAEGRLLKNMVEVV